MKVWMLWQNDPYTDCYVLGIFKTLGAAKKELLRTRRVDGDRITKQLAGVYKAFGVESPATVFTIEQTEVQS